MKKQLFAIMLTAFISHVCLSQDVITYKNGKETRGRVTEVTSTEVKFKKEDNPDGPVYVLPKAEIFMIQYAGGNKEVFADKVEKNTSTTISRRQQVITDDRLRFSGPRIGFTVIGDGWAADEIHDLGKNPFITQFGWQFETQIFTLQDGMAGLFEFVPLIGGIEQGMFLPSASALMGIRGKNGTEFAFGPNLSVTGAGMVIAVGTSFRKENVYFPINLAVLPSVSQKRWVDKWDPASQTTIEVRERVKTGVRVSLLIGFMTRKR
jgi:hypothetical protein